MVTNPGNGSHGRIPCPNRHLQTRRTLLRYIGNLIGDHCMSESQCILLAEDNEDDVSLFRTALERAGISNPLRVVRDGEQAIRYLSGQGSYSDRNRFPFPGLLVSDLKMPRCDGFQLLEWMQKSTLATQPPAVIFSTSTHDMDRERALELGAREYVVKPAGFKKLAEIATRLKQKWLDNRARP